MECVPTSKDHSQSRTSRGRHVPFYSSTVSTLAIIFNHDRSRETLHRPCSYAIIISVEALLPAIHAGARSVPWVDWGPSKTHIFEINQLASAGPSWITDFSPLTIRQYDLRRTQHTQPTAEGTLSSQTGPPLFPSTEEFSEPRDENNTQTNLPYRDVVANDLNFLTGTFSQILVDREWVVRAHMTRVRAFLCIQTGGV